MPNAQNGPTHSNNSSAKADELCECVWPFLGVGSWRVNLLLWNCNFWWFIDTTLYFETKFNFHQVFTAILRFVVPVIFLYFWLSSDRLFSLQFSQSFNFYVLLAKVALINALLLQWSFLSFSVFKSTERVGSVMLRMFDWFI